MAFAALTGFVSRFYEAVMPHEEWAPNDPKLSSALSTVSGASWGTLIGSGVAAVTLAAIGPVAIAVPSLITLAGGGIGALGGYLSHKRQEKEGAITPARSSNTTD